MYLNIVKLSKVKILSILIILLTVVLGKFTYAANKKICNNDCQIPVEFIGTYLESTCSVSVDGGSKDGFVKLPKISISNLPGTGDEAGKTRFSIALDNCPANSTIELFLRNSGGNVDTSTGNLINENRNNFAENVQLRIRKENEMQMRIDDVNSVQEYIIPAISSEVTHYYSVSYFAENNSVKPGDVRAKAVIDLNYK